MVLRHVQEANTLVNPKNIDYNETGMRFPENFPQ